MKVVFFETKDWERAYLRERLEEMTVVFEEPGAPPTESARNHKDADCLSPFIQPVLDAGVLSQFSAVKLVATRSTGFDHIDLEYCKKHGIAVTNVPTYGENTVAEHTFALILMLSRKVHQSYEQVRAGHVERAALTGFDLQGKTLGVIGAGHIGLHAIRIGRGFGMRVLAWDKKRDPFLADLLGFRYVDLEKLLQESDIVSLHCGLTPETTHLLGRKQFAMMKKGGLVINTGRGGLIDTDALAEALDNGQIGGAGLDVVEGEELIQEERQLLQGSTGVDKLREVLRNRRLLARDNVVFTPHNAFNSQEALYRILDTTVANLEGFRAGIPVNRVAETAVAR
jgi:D-lactate dehydrogenase